MGTVQFGLVKQASKEVTFEQKKKMMCDSLAVMVLSKYLHKNPMLGVFDCFAPVFCQKHVEIMRRAPPNISFA